MTSREREPSSQRGSLRASDADRERVAERLRHDYGEGRLTADDLSERVEAVYAARTQADLEALTADLPAIRGPDVPRRRSGLETSVRVHLRTYLVVNVLLIAIWAASGGGYFWPIWPILGWGIGVIADSGGSLGRPCRRRSSNPGSSTGRLPSSPAEGRG